MRRTVRALAFLPLSFALAAHAGAAGCTVTDPPADKNGKLAWNGACKDGFADGPGVLESYVKDKLVLKYEVTMAHGAISGAGKMTAGANGAYYSGTFHDGVPHGKGNAHYGNGNEYDGELDMFKPDGTGTMRYTNGTIYQGHWKQGKRDGVGRATFGLGGSYEGEWQDDHFEGEGTITYAGSGRRQQGRFHDGRLAGIEAVAKENRTYTQSELRGFGEHVKRAVARFPTDKTWAELTPAQREVTRRGYPALAAGDEPPYPVDPEQFYDELSRLGGTYSAVGRLLLYVQVGADGNAKAVTPMIGSPQLEVVQRVTRLAMRQKYKPAVCDGTPCDMIYPLLLGFTLE